MTVFEDDRSVVVHLSAESQHELREWPAAVGEAGSEATPNDLSGAVLREPGDTP